MVNFDELRRMAEKEPVEEIHPDEAMRRLGSAFAALKEIKDGKVFFEEMARTFRQMGDGEIDREGISIHTIIGICQLAHHIRDEVGPSRQKSFNRIIPWLLQRRDKIKKKPPEDIVQYMVQKFDDRDKEMFGW